MSEKRDPQITWEGFVRWVTENYAIISVTLLTISIIIAIIALRRR